MDVARVKTRPARAYWPARQPDISRNYALATSVLSGKYLKDSKQLSHDSIPPSRTSSESHTGINWEWICARLPCSDYRKHRMTGIRHEHLVNEPYILGTPANSSLWPLAHSFLTPPEMPFRRPRSAHRLALRALALRFSRQFSDQFFRSSNIYLSPRTSQSLKQPSRNSQSTGIFLCVNIY